MTGNSIDGPVSGSVQAQHIAGDVHLHAPAKPAATPPAQIPAPPGVYTNNERQLEDITAALGHPENTATRPGLVVIRGPVGGGKTSLACQWAHEHRDEFPDGAFFAPMAESRGRGDLEPELGRAGGAGAESECLLQFLREVGFGPAEIPNALAGRANLFRSWSTGKRVLVVVDGPVRGSQARPLLPGDGGSAVLVAGPLMSGDLRMDRPAFVDMDPLSPESAKELVGRILPDDPRPEQEPEPFDQLVETCREHTIALCVAAELLAERPKRTIAWLVQRLSRERETGLKALSSDSARSVPAVFNTAVAEFDAPTRRTYVAAGQHPGRADVGVDACAAALGEDRDEVQDRLDRLAGAWLIEEVAQDRYLMGDLARRHARELAGEEAFASRFARFYADRAIGAGNAVMPQRGWMERLWPDQDLAVTVEAPESWLDTERANLRATAEHLAETADTQLLPLAVALWPFHERAKHLDDMDRVNELAADLAQQRGHQFAAGLALVQRGFAFRHRGEHDKAAELFAAAERIVTEHGPRDLAATVVESFGVVRREQDDVAAARELLRRNLAMARGIGDRRRTALAQMHLGSVEHPAEAVPMLDEAVEGFRGLPTPDRHNEHKSLLWRGIRQVELGHLGQSHDDLNAALRHMSDEKRPFEIAQAHAALGGHAAASGAAERARQHYEHALETYRAWGFADRAERVRAELDEL